MNKPSVPPPDGWRWFEVGERVRAGDSVGVINQGVSSLCTPISVDEPVIGVIENGECGNMWFIRRVDKPPAQPPAAPRNPDRERMRFEAAVRLMPLFCRGDLYADSAQVAAKLAFEFADALLAELDKPREKSQQPENKQS